MAKRKARINLSDIVSYRLSHSYAETLDAFRLTPGRFFNVVKDAYVQNVVDQSGLEQCLVIERPTLDHYFSEVRSGESVKLPRGIHLAKQNNINLVEIVLEKLPAEENQPGYAAATREEKIVLIREHVINYKSDTPDADNGALQFFYDNGLRGLMKSSPHLRKIGSPIALMELYDQEKNVGLFDRTKPEYLCRWEIGENGMWQDDSSKELAVEAIEDVLWRIPGYRQASREEKIKLIRKHVINYKSQTHGTYNGAFRFFRDNGLSGLMARLIYLRKRNSPIALMELYDQERKVGLFDKSKEDYLEMKKQDGNSKSK